MALFTTTRDSISYDLRPEYRESYAEGHYQIEQVALVNWEDKDDFLSAILPQVRTDPAVQIENMTLTPYEGSILERVRVQRIKLERDNPQEHPNYSSLHAMDYEVLNGVGHPERDAIGRFVFETRTPNCSGKAEIKVVWKTLPYRVDISDAAANAVGASELMRYCSMKTSYSGQNLEIQPGRNPLEVALNSTSAAITADMVVGRLTENLRKPMAETHVAITWHYVPVIPRASTYMMILVNETTITPPDAMYRSPWRPGTLLYLSAEVTPFFYTYDGTRCVNITYHFLHRDNGRLIGYGHNHIYSHVYQGFVRAFRRSNSAPQFPTGDLAWLPAQGPIGARYGGNIHDYAQLMNLFRIDATDVTLG